MSLLVIFRVAFRALARNKMRSSLTMLGIIIGVAAVIAMVSVGQGAHSQPHSSSRFWSALLPPFYWPLE